MVGEREYKFLEILSAEKEISQRKLAKTLGISLGMTNLILKNLIKKGKKSDIFSRPEVLAKKQENLTTIR